MVARQLPIDLPFKPHSGFMVLTGGAVTIAARSKDRMRTCAFIALINQPAVMIRAAIDDGIDNFTMLRRDGQPESVDVLGCISPEDFFNRRHGHLLLGPPKLSSEGGSLDR